MNVLTLSPEHVLLYKSFLFIYILVKYIKIILYILRYIFYKILYIINMLYSLITLEITCNIEAHCIGWKVGPLAADSKVIQKSTQNLKIMWLAIQFSWSGQHVGQDPNKSLTPTKLSNT